MSIIYVRAQIHAIDNFETICINVPRGVDVTDDNRHVVQSIEDTCRGVRRTLLPAVEKLLKRIHCAAGTVRGEAEVKR
jgi:hypothetical protein